MIHEITTQLAAKLAPDGANSRASMASNPPCHSLTQTLNPGNPSHVSSFYADNYHTTSAAIAPRLTIRAISVGIPTDLI